MLCMFHELVYYCVADLFIQFVEFKFYLLKAGVWLTKFGNYGKGLARDYRGVLDFFNLQILNLLILDFLSNLVAESSCAPLELAISSHALVINSDCGIEYLQFSVHEFEIRGQVHQ